MKSIWNIEAWHVFESIFLQQYIKVIFFEYTIICHHGPLWHDLLYDSRIHLHRRNMWTHIPEICCDKIRYDMLHDSGTSGPTSIWGICGGHIPGYAVTGYEVMICYMTSGPFLHKGRIGRIHLYGVLLMWTWDIDIK